MLPATPVGTGKCIRLRTELKRAAQPSSAHPTRKPCTTRLQLLVWMGQWLLWKALNQRKQRHQQRKQYQKQEEEEETKPPLWTQQQRQRLTPPRLRPALAKTGPPPRPPLPPAQQERLLEVLQRRFPTTAPSQLQLLRRGC